MKIIWHRISIQTLLFQACLSTRQNVVENRDKAYWTSTSPRSNYVANKQAGEPIRNENFVIDTIIN